MSLVFISGCIDQSISIDLSKRRSNETNKTMEFNESQKTIELNKTILEPEPEPIINISLEGEEFCSEPADCVPAQCCHPSYLVNKRYAPDCSNTACTAVCGSILDCKQWVPTCENNTCGYRFETKDYVWTVDLVGCYGCTANGQIIDVAHRIEADLLKNEYMYNDYTMWVKGTKDLPKSQALHEIHFRFTEEGYNSFTNLNLSEYGILYVYVSR